MRSYQADLARRIGPVFAEQAAQPKTTSDRNLPVGARPTYHEKQAIARRFDKCVDAGSPVTARHYKPTHGGYPTVGARA